MIKTYTKGARAERDLIYLLNSHGFACVRCASSGGWFSPIDVLALRQGGRVIAFECKAHKTMPKLEKSKLRRFKEWCENAGAWGFLAWRPPKKPWKFLPLNDAENGRYDEDRWITFEDLLDIYRI